MLILVVDDDKLARQGLAALLGELVPHAELAEAADGVGMIEAVRSLDPDVAIVDVDMPRLDGLSAVEELAKEEHGTSFVVLSAFADFSFARRGIKLHVSDYLLKPAEPADLLAAISRAAHEGERRLREREALFGTEISELVRSRLRAASEPGADGPHTQVDPRFDYLAAVVFADGTVDQPTAGSVTDPVAEAVRCRRRVVAAVRASVPGARTPVGVVVVRHPQHEDVAELVDLACRHHSGDGPMLTAFWAAGSSPAEALAPLEPYLLEPSLRLLGRPGRAVPAPDLPGQLVSRYCAGIDAVFEAVHLADEVRYRAAVEKLRTLGASWPRELRLADVASFTSARLGYAVQWSHPRAFLDQLTAFAPRVGKRSSSPAASRIGRIQEHLAENFAEPLSLASVAKRFDLTPTYLSALFHAKTGKTFLAYLTELRISYARQVLESDPEVQVRELAALSGYTSVRHFSQVFRRLTGSYPSKYLEELAGGDAAGRPTSEISSDDPLQVER